jgi:hypothetical protein
MALKDLYPDVEWLPWKFSKVPRRFWESRVNQRLFLEWFAKEKGIQKKEDWHTVTTAAIRASGGARLLFYYNGSLVNGTCCNTVSREHSELYKGCHWDYLYRNIECVHIYDIFAFAE